MKKLALSLLMVVSTCLSAQSADLTWINGVDVCTGNWSYTKLGYCGYKDDLSRPIPKTVYDISYTPNTCQHAKND